MAHEHLINVDERLDVAAKHAKTNKTAATPSKAGAVLQALVWVDNVVWVDNEARVAVADHLVVTSCWLISRSATTFTKTIKKKNAHSL